MVIRKWLLESGYIFNPPKLTSNEGENWDCFENILKEDSDFDNSKLYACGSAFISFWNGGDETKKIDYLTFISEFFIRKGKDGLKITSMFDSRGNNVGYNHKIDVFIKKNNLIWHKEKESVWDLSDDLQRGGSETKELNIEMPNGAWYQDRNYSNSSNSGSETHESFKESKSWSGIWVEDSNNSDSSIFQNIKISIKGEKNFSFFSLNEDDDSDDSEEIKQKLVQKIKQITNSSSGKWLNAEEICKVGNKRKKDMQQDEIKNLRIFCFKSKNSPLKKSNS